MISQKSQFAYRRNCHKITQYARQQGERLYFWTFTTSKQVSDSWIGGIWVKWILAVRHLYDHEESPLIGIRVLDRHKSGKLHWHCIINKRVSVDLLRKMGKRYGIGRQMHVKRVTYVKGAWDYLEGYMEKDIKILVESSWLSGL